MSIVSKVLLQIVAKLGHRPWIIDSLPLTNQPMMVTSLVIEKKNGNNSIYFTYSVDKYAAR
jgi:hypothetical protein